MKVLVTGGAGYIGSVVVDTLIDKGYDVVVVDNLSLGHRDAVNEKAKLCQAGIDSLDCREAFNDVDYVIHLAAHATIGGEPFSAFYHNNSAALFLLQTAMRQKVKRFIFASSGAVYGDVDLWCEEDQPLLAPCNVYGESKLIFEKMLHWYSEHHELLYTTFRFFNVCGATKTRGERRGDQETHLIPLLLNAAESGQPFTLNGDNYDTEDGTCVRDYIHVQDIANAIVDELTVDDQQSKIFNLSSNIQCSTAHIISVVEELLDTKIDVRIGPPREGDPVYLMADSSLIKDYREWKPTYTNIRECIQSVIAWRKEYGGYF